MNCTKTRQAIVAGDLTPEATLHLSECATCRMIHEKVDLTMSILEEPVAAPDMLADAILSRRDHVPTVRTRRIGLATFIQIAAAVLLGIFIGHQFGRHAGSLNRRMEKDPVGQYFRAHHFTVNHSDFRIP